MKQFVKKKVSFVMVMIMAVITVISMSLPMAVFAQGGVLQICFGGMES